MRRSSVGLFETIHRSGNSNHRTWLRVPVVDTPKPIADRPDECVWERPGLLRRAFRRECRDARHRQGRLRRARRRRAGRPTPGLAAQGRRGRPGPEHSACRSWRTSSPSCARRDRAQPARPRGRLLARAARPRRSTSRRSSARSRGRSSACADSAPRRSSTSGSAESLQQVWIALRANLRKVLEHVTVADVAAGKLPKDAIALTRDEDAWRPARSAAATSSIARVRAHCGRASVSAIPRTAANTRGARRRTARIWPSVELELLRPSRA